MTTYATTSAPLSARLFLLGEGGSPATTAALRDAMRRRGVAGVASDSVGQLSRSAVDAVQTDVASVVDGLLDIDVADLVVGAWRTHTALTGAARRTCADPGTVEVVDLFRHTMTATYRPYVDVLLDTVTAARIEIIVAVTFLVTGLAATVRNGALIGLTGGRCAVDGSLVIHGVPVLQRSAAYDPGLLVPVGAGIPLLRPVEGGPGRSPAPPPA